MDENLRLEDLRPNPKNPRTISDPKLKQLKKAIEAFGDLGGFVYNLKSKQLVGGHQRAKLFPKSKITITKKYSEPTKTGTVAEGYVRIRDERFKYREVMWDEDTEKAANLAANKNAGEWDFEALTGWMKDLNSSGFDLATTMFDAEELGQYLKGDGGSSSDTGSGSGETDDDKIPDAPTKPISKRGDLYELGNHRLLCGDSTSIETVEEFIGQKKIDLVFTDPPYLQDKVGGGYIGKKKFAHEVEQMGLNSFNPTPFFEMLKVLNAPNLYIFGSKKLILPYLQFFESQKRKWDLLAMCKINPTPSKAKNFLPDIEWLFFSRQPGAYFNDQLDFSYYFKAKDITIHPREHGHPTEKQVSFIEPYIQISSPDGGLVFDPYGGAGSTLIACEKQGRSCSTMEIDPRYCDVIVKRWEDLTQKKAKLLK